MAAKLKSILRQIHWSSLLKAAVFGAAWLWLPYWAFFFAALYLYYVPIFEAKKLGIPFFILLILAYLQGQGIFPALIFSAIFYGILLIKDLLIIDRRSAYELLGLVESFLLLRIFYSHFTEGPSGLAVTIGFFVATALTLLLNSFIQCFRDESGDIHGVRRAGVWLSLPLFSQMIITGLFLPLDFLYQAVSVFLISVLVFDLLPDHLARIGSRQKTLATVSVVFSLFVIVLASANWGI